MKIRLAAIAAVLVIPTAAFAGIGEELTLAQTHALLAYRSGGRGERGLAQGKMHFHHVLNCLVGPGGAGYDAAPPNMDPCAGDKTNKGALNDAASPAQKEKVQAAVALVKADLEITDNDKLTEAATALADAVGEAKETK